MDPARSEPLDGRVEQDLLQRAPMDRELRPGIAGREPACLSPDLLAPPRAVHERLGRDGAPAQVVEQPERVELAHGVRQQVDADAERAHLAGGLEHVDLDTDLVEPERGREPADAAADHHDVQPGTPRAHSTSCTWM